MRHQYKNPTNHLSGNVTLPVELANQQKVMQYNAGNALTR